MSLDAEPVEVLLVLLLSTRHRLIGYHVVSRGSLDSTRAEPREIFRLAVTQPCAAIILAHNHPSGDPSPSPDDVAITHRLVSAGHVLGVPVLDHVIIGEAGQYASLKDRGML